MDQFVFTATDGAKSLNKLVVGSDGNLRHWAFVNGQGWVINGEVRCTGVDPNSEISRMPANEFDTSIQLALRADDGKSLIHGFVDPSGNWGFERLTVA